jgi:hypothetical protein
MSKSTIGLITFIVICIINIVGLLVDSTLVLIGWPTVTSHVVSNWWLGIPIVVIQLVAAVSLLVHFYMRTPDKRCCGVDKPPQSGTEITTPPRP